MWNLKLKEAREQKEMTQQDLAKLVGISRGCYSNYELGTREPPYEILSKICWTLDVTADYILGLEDETGRKTNIYNNYGTHNGDVKF